MFSDIFYAPPQWLLWPNEINKRISIASHEPFFPGPRTARGTGTPRALPLRGDRRSSTTKYLSLLLNYYYYYDRIFPSESALGSVGAPRCYATW